MVKRKISDFKRNSAKRLRANSTNAEMVLWHSLRRLNINVTHFRRQVPIGRYIADFACLAERLIVEVDGSQHSDGRQAAHDLARTQWLESEGYRVLRFWNNDVIARTHAVMEAIYHSLSITPPRLPKAGDPPPPGEG